MSEQYKQVVLKFILCDGKIRRVNEYFCTILTDEKLWPLVSGMKL